MDRLETNLALQAGRFRQNNGLSPAESIRIKSLLQKNNVITVFFPLSDNFSGMAIKIGDGEAVKRFMLVNSAHTVGRQHFTICHELYHLYYQEHFHSGISNAGIFNKKGDTEEYKADIFASHLLLPENGLLGMIPENEMEKDKISLKTVLAIENYYSCSRRALLQRLQRMKLISSELYEKYSSDIMKNAILYGYNRGVYLPGNSNVVIGDYGTIARELFDRGDISESSYFSMLQDLGIDLSEYDSKAGHEQ